MSDKKKWDNPVSEIPEDAVSPGAISPKPARAGAKPVQIEPQEVRSQSNAPIPAVEATEGVDEQPAAAHVEPTFAVGTQDRAISVPVVARPSWGKRLLGFLLALALGAAGVLGYQYWGPKPEIESLAGCLDRTVPGLETANSQRLRVVLVPLLNDLEDPQGRRIQSALNDLQGSDGPLMQVQTVDCPLIGDTDTVLELASMVRENSLEIARKTNADVLIWGEVLRDDERLELRVNYPIDNVGTHFATDDVILKTDFGADQATVFAAKIWSVSKNIDRLDETVLTNGMTATRDALLPISQNSKPELSVRQLGSLYHELGVADFVLGVQSEASEQMESAIEHYRSADILLDRYVFPDDWAQNQNDLGIALTTLGMKDNRNQEIGQAVSAFQDAMVEISRSRNPIMWAQLQGRLAEALNALGTREANNQMLAASISAYQQALKVQSREDFPEQWASSQHNLGAALQGLGQRDGDPAILEDAVSAYRAALEVRTADKLPNDHAITQINLGSTLMTIGARVKNIEVIEQAVTAYRAAIDQLDQQESVIEWATAQHSLGNALAFIAEQEGNTDNLEEALTAFTLALDNFDRETDPTRWAVTQNNIGNVLHTLGERRKDPEAIAAAIAAYEAAVSVLSESAPAYAERVVESLSRAQVLQQTMGSE